MSGIRRTSDLGSQGIKTILDGSVQSIDIANGSITSEKMDTNITISGTTKTNILNIGANTVLGTVQIGDSTINGSDGNIVVGKRNADGSVNRHFKIGYDSSFNICIGDYGSNGTAGTWASAIKMAYNTPSSTIVTNSSGYVGINSTSPDERLTIGGNLRIESTVAGGEGAHIRLENKSSTVNTTAGIYFGVDSGSASPADTGNAEILCYNSGSGNKGILTFRVYDGTDAEAMKICGNGSDYAPAEGGGSNLANGVAFANAGIAIDKGWASYPGIHVFNTTGYGDTKQGEFRVHGWNTSYSSYPNRAGSDFGVNFRIDGSTYYSSDMRHKTNIVDNPHGLETIKQLQPRKFDRINSQGQIEESNRNILGFIAQEVIEVLPEAVKYYPDEDNPNENGWCRAYSLSESYIVSTLVNAVKELNQKIEDLTNQINNQG